MATEQILAARRVRALQDQANQMAEVNERLGLIMKHLGIAYPAIVQDESSEPVEPVVPEVAEQAEPVSDQKAKAVSKAKAKTDPQN